MRKQRNLALVTKPAEPPSQKKLPRQARSKFTLDVILEAAELLLQDGGLRSVTMRRVALRAGVGIGTLYDYFPNRDAILIQLLNRKMKRHCEEESQRFRGTLSDSLPALFHASIKQAVEMDRALMHMGADFHSRYARHFFFGTYYAEINSPLRRRTLDHIEKAASDLLVGRPDVVGEKDTALAAFMLSRALRGVVSTLIEERPELLDSPSLVPMMQRVMLAIADISPAATRPA